MTQPWTLELGNWTEANIQSLELIHRKANDAFDYTINVAEKISARAFTFISILIPIISLIIGLLGKQLFEQDAAPSSLLISVMLLLCIPALSSLAALIWLIFPRKFMGRGREPQHLADAVFIQTDDYSKAEQYTALLIGEIEDLQHKIHYNDQINFRRIRILKWVLWVISISLFSSLLLLITSATHIFG